LPGKCKALGSIPCTKKERKEKGRKGKGREERKKLNLDGHKKSKLCLESYCKEIRFL
jgi:hypothetical protein